MEAAFEAVDAFWSHPAAAEYASLRQPGGVVEDSQSGKLVEAISESPELRLQWRNAFDLASATVSRIEEYAEKGGDMIRAQHWFAVNSDAISSAFEGVPYMDSWRRNKKQGSDTDAVPESFYQRLAAMAREALRRFFGTETQDEPSSGPK